MMAMNAVMTFIKDTSVNFSKTIEISNIWWLRESDFSLDKSETHFPQPKHEIFSLSKTLLETISS